MLVGDVFDQSFLRHQIFQRTHSGVRRIEHGRIKLVPKHLFETIQLACLSSVPFLLVNLLPSDFGDNGFAIAHAGVTLQAKKGERRENNQQQQKLHQPLMGAEEIKHGALLVLARGRANHCVKHKKRRTLGSPFWVWRSGRDSNPRPPA